MNNRYQPIDALVPCYLNAETPAGLFYPTSGGVPILVVPSDGGPAAIMLADFGGRGPFHFWRLQKHDTTWAGVSFGPVEIEVDPASLVYEDAGRGAMHLAAGRLALRVEGKVPWDRPAIPVASISAGANNSEGVQASFTRWRLIQRDHLGAPVEVFAYDVANFAFAA